MTMTNVDGGYKNKTKTRQTGRTKSKKLNQTHLLLRTSSSQFTREMQSQAQARKPAGHKQERRTAGKQARQGRRRASEASERASKQRAPQADC